MIKVRKGGFVYNVAYCFTDSLQIPCRTNLCKLFWRFFGMGLLLIFLIILGLCVVCVFFVIGFAFAARPTIFEEDDHYKQMCHYHRWPRLRGKRIWPIFPIGCIALVRYNDAIGKAAGHVADGSKAIVLSPYFWYVIVGCIGVVILIYLKERSKNSEAYKLCRQYISAKKEKICPIVIIEHD